MDEAQSGYAVVLVTAPSRAAAETIANALIDAKFAACVSLLPVHSIYTWHGSVEHADEWQLLIKTGLARFEALTAQVQQIHPYEVPEIIALPIVAGSPSYLSWIASQTRPDSQPGGSV